MCLSNLINVRLNHKYVVENISENKSLIFIIGFQNHKKIICETEEWREYFNKIFVHSINR